ncbi:MAG: SelT/SelW/SelH family protein [Nitrospinae bacterium]|nr:SelT/SelW/SelH family protein [Nitrospinota bacterium]
MPQAVSLAQAIMDSFGQKFGSLKLIPSDGGRFEVSLDGKLIFSKLQTGRFPENKEVIDQIKSIVRG